MFLSSARRLSLRKLPGGILCRAAIQVSVTDSNTDPLPAKLSIAYHPFPINDIPMEESSAIDRFAIIEFSGTQYKVTVDDVFVANKMEGIEIGSIVEIDDVLLVGSRKATIVGQPKIPGAKVITRVEEIAKDKKVVIFKMRRRKGSKRKNGFRRQVTILRVTEIHVGADNESDL